jgi:hypothetical protein
LFIDKNQLITIAANSKLLINLTAKLCNYRYIKDDLFQEFLLLLLETEEQKLIDKMKEGKFISHCSNLIHRLNMNRYRDKKYVNSRNVLVERNDTFELNFEIKDESYNFDIDMKFEKVVKLVREQPLKGQILFQSVVTSTREIASELGMNHRQLIYQNVKFKAELKNKLK